MRLARWLAVTVVAAALWSIGAPAQAAPPSNDKPTGAVRIPALPFTYQQSTAGATAENFLPGACGVNDASVWFKFTAHDYGPAVVQTRGSSFDTSLAVMYAQNGKPAFEAACSDDSARLRSAVTFYTSPGNTYFIQVAGFLGATGTLRLAVNRGGKLSGVARDGSTGRPVPNACITFEGPTTYNGDFFAFTSPTGYYEINGLVSGEYRPSNNPYVCAPHRARVWPQPALIAEGLETRAPPLLLDSGYVEGKVLDQQTRAPIANACVAGINSVGSYVSFTSSSPTGYYQLVAPPGPLRVTFLDCTGLQRYAPEFYDGAAGLSGATPVNVGAGVTTSHVDATLLRAAALVGNVRDARTGSGLDACVQVYLPGEAEPVGYGYTFGSSTGFYRIAGLPPTDVIVQARACSVYPPVHAPAWFPRASLRGGAEPVALAPGVNRRADFRLDRGGSIAGVLRRDAGGVAQDDCVLAVAPDGATTYTSSSPTGLYLLSALPHGQYRVRFGGCNATAPEWYRDAGDKASGQELLVNVGDRVTVNASVAREGRFRATLVDPTSPKRPAVCVTAHTGDVADYYDFQFPTVTGLVGFGNLGATTYQLSAFNCADDIEGGFQQALGSFQGVPAQVKNLGNLAVKLRDRDGDGVPDRTDNCPLTSNPNQADVNNDDLGNVCDRLRRA